MEEEEEEQVRTILLILFNIYLNVTFSLNIAADDTAYAPRVDHRKPCQWGSRCKEIGDQNHRAKYSHK